VQTFERADDDAILLFDPQLTRQKPLVHAVKRRAIKSGRHPPYRID